MSIGSNVVKLRYEMRWTQRDLAFHLEMSQTGVSQIELGTRNPSFKVIMKLKALAKKHKLKIKFLEDE